MSATPTHPMQLELGLDFADLLVLEYAGLGRRYFDSRSFLTGLLSYPKVWLPALAAGGTAAPGQA